jgi:hypothetical protein
MKYRYLLKGNENRTLGVKYSDGSTYDWGQYMLLGQATPATSFLATYRSLIPAANVTTLRVDVTPGSQFDGILGATYNCGGFSFDLGYNLYFREAEKVKLDQHLPASTYFVAARNLTTAIGTARAILNTDVDGAGAAGGSTNVWYVDDAHLDLKAAETPSQFTNSIYGGLGFQFREWEVPAMVGIGGKYEFANDNSALEQWSVWGKMGVSF